MSQDAEEDTSADAAGVWTRRNLLGALGVGAVGGGGAWYLYTRPPEGKLTPEDGDANYRFGWSVALSHDGATALVGSPGADGETGDEGAAYVFTGGGQSKQQTAKLTANARQNENQRDEDFMSVSVELSNDGTTALVAANQDIGSDESLEGSVYVFSRSGDSWTHQTTLLPEDPETEVSMFGSSIALSGDGTTALIAQYSHDTHAYLFSRSGGSWEQVTKFDAIDAPWNPYVALSADGTTALLSGWEEENPLGDEKGAVYVLSGEDESWTQVAKLAPEDGEHGDEFGRRVAISDDGSTVIGGRSRDVDPNGRDAGSAYVFAEDGDTWSLVAKLAAEDGDPGDSFGNEVAVSADGTTALIGAVNDEDPNGEEAGSAYVFSNQGGSWRQERKLTAPDGDSGDSFARSVTLSGDGSTALVSAYNDEDPNGNEGGSAYVFGL